MALLFDTAQRPDRPGFLCLCLIAVLILGGCSGNTEPEDHPAVPVMGSSYLWVTTTSSTFGPALQVDSVLYTVSAQIGSFQGEENVTQFTASGLRSPLYLQYHANGDVSRYYPAVYFPFDAYRLPPHWGYFPYSTTERNEVLLFNTFNEDPHIRYTLVTEGKGREEVEVNGVNHIGYRLDYTFVFELEDEGSSTTIAGRTLHVPAIGWPAWTEEITERSVDGEVVDRKVESSRLSEYVLLK